LPWRERKKEGKKKRTVCLGIFVGGGGETKQRDEGTREMYTNQIPHITGRGRVWGCSVLAKKEEKKKDPLFKSD